MKIIQITPGAGGDFLCDNCLRDNALVLELRRLGHDTLMVPLYLPIAVEGPAPAAGMPIFFGGINVYLQQKSALFRRTPRWIDRLLDSPRLLRWAARRAAMTKARDLGEPTLSMIRGEEGRQRKELERLIAWLAAEGRPDVICLSNALLAGMVRRMKAEIGAPVVCLLQDEDAFLDALPEPYRAEAWRTVRERAAEADGLVAVSRYYADAMRSRLGVPADRIHTVHIGIDTSGFDPAPAPPQPPVIGYVGLLSAARGFDTVVEAFLRLRAGGRFPGLRLRAAGSVGPDDGPFVEKMRRRLDEAGAAGEAEIGPGLDKAGRQRFLRTVSAVAVPARAPEAFGLFAVEAMAAGVPLVLSRVGAYPELIEATGGGVLVEPDNPAALAEALEPWLARPDEARAVGERGRQGVFEQFSISRMAGGLLDVFNTVVNKGRVY
jgi:glycosyltransferase involved in cell wall biosynthesis